ncbi:MAG: glycosyltransferase [Candidatus Omnitrophica bacterium]|nr:glycosyltransferase [Candidatus Omnitrophota bacterium]
MQNKAKILFLSYNGLLEPILPSQAVPYLEKLVAKGFGFMLFTYEKKRDLERVGKGKIEILKGELRSKGIDWRYLPYHKRPPLLSTLFDLAAGAAAVSRLVRKEKVDIIHVRGITPGIIVLMLSRLLKVKVLFDMRGLLAEEYVGGGLWKEDSLAFRAVKMAERNMLLRADAITVLTQKHLEFNRTLDYLKDRDVPMDVIPCCVDMDRFGYNRDNDTTRSELGIDGSFVIMYPGKIGTFYLMKEMLEFYKVLTAHLPKAVFLILTNDDTAAVLEKARAIGIDERGIKIVRGIRFEEMPRYMAVADAGIFFINPYKKIGSSPIKMGEFLASGVPVVINPGVGDTEELVRNNNIGVVVEGFEERDYKDAALRLMAMKGEGETLKRRCRDAAMRCLSLSEGADKYEKIYGILSRSEGKA